MAESSKKRNGEFPLYLMELDGVRHFVSINLAGGQQDYGYEIVGLVLEEGYTVRDITDEERDIITKIADQISESK